MNVDAFTSQRQPAWTELETLIGRARNRLERLPPDDVLRAGFLYRATAADLAIARRRYPGDPVLVRLERLVTSARSLVYEGGPRRMTIVGFFSREYWVAIRERPRVLAAAAVLLLAPAVLGALWAIADTDHASGFVPTIYRSVSERRDAPRQPARAASEGPAVSSLIFTNNIRVTFLSFAGGIAFGLGTAIVLLFNGAFLGVVAGLATASGNGRFLAEFVIAHGVLELSCIVVAGAAGLRIGWALVDPGYRPRSQVLIEEGRRAVEIVFGTMPWLVVAGLVEGFITPAGLGLAVVLPVGITLGAVFWGLVIWRGKPSVIPVPALSL